MALCLFGCGGGGGSSSPSPQTTNAAAGTATLTWNPVTNYTDGSTLSVLGYYIYYGSVHNNYSQKITVIAANLNNPNVPSYTIKNLPPGICYFVVSAYDSNMVEGAQSLEVSKVIQ